MKSRILALSIAVLLLATACAAPEPADDTSGRLDEPVITVYRAPT